MEIETNHSSVGEVYNSSTEATWVTDIVLRTISNINVDPYVSLKIPAIMFALGVFGNVLALIVLFRAPKEHKQSVFYRLVGALAATDLLGTCMTSPVTLAVYANNLRWVGGDALCRYHSFMLTFAGMSTISIIGVMAAERFCAIIIPYFYNRHVTKERAKFGVIAVWTLAFIIALLPVIGLGKIEIRYPGSWCFFDFNSREIKNQIIPFTFAFIGLTFLLTTIVLNVLVTISILKMRRRAMRCRGDRTSQKCSCELQMMVQMLGIITVFVTCWGPFLVSIYCTFYLFTSFLAE